MKIQRLNTIFFIFIFLFTLNAWGVDDSSSSADLVQQLHDPVKGIDAAHFLAKRGKTVVPALVEVLTGTSQPGSIDRQVNALLALMELGPAANEAVPVVEKLLGPLEARAYNCKIRSAATFCLVYISRDPEPYTPYLEGVYRDSLVCKEAIYRFLGIRLNERNSPEVKALLYILEFLIQQGYEDMDILEQSTQIPALVRIGSPALFQVGDALVHHKEPMMRQVAAFILGNMKSEAIPALPLLINALKARDTEVQRAAVEAIEAIGPAAGAAVPALVELLNRSSEDWMRSVVIEALEKLGPAALSAVPALNKIKNLHPHLASPVDGALQRLEDPTAILAVMVQEKGCQAIPELVDMLQKSRSDSLILPVAENLQTFGPASVPYLTEALQTADPQAKVNILTAFNSLGPRARAAVPWLIPLLEDQNPLVRRCAAEALGKIGPDAGAALPYLEKMLEEKDEYTRLVTRIALARIRTLHPENRDQPGTAHD
jgi:HEAT repeat protein